MKTFWKIFLTFGVLALFVLVIAFSIFIVTQWSDMPVLGRGSVAIIPIKGMITMGGCPGGLFFIEDCAQVGVIKKYLKEAGEDSSIKAIVLDIDSGGGNVVASRELMRAVKKIRKKKPVVSWIGEVGASGAYYVASASDIIVADEDSITGSIGVIMFVQHYYELFDEIGINVTVIKSGNVKDIASPYRPMKKAEVKKLQDMIDEVYMDFVNDVAKNRKLTPKYVQKVADGSIYLGSQAKELKLIDENGGLEYAIKRAGELGKIEGEPETRTIEKKIGLKDILLEN